MQVIICLFFLLNYEKDTGTTPIHPGPRRSEANGDDHARAPGCGRYLYLTEADHTPRFWNIVRTQAPLMDKAKAWLKENVALLEEAI